MVCSSSSVIRSIRTGPGGYLYTYWQEWATLSYVYLKRFVVDDSVHTEPLHQWVMQPAWQPTRNMVTSTTSDDASASSEYETHDLRGLFRCFLSVVSATFTTRLVALSMCVMMRMLTRALVFHTICSRPIGNWPSRPLALWTGGWGQSTSPSSWQWSPELWSSSTTCKWPMPVGWVPGSCANPITMIRPSSIWSRTSFTKTPTTGPSAWMPLTLLKNPRGIPQVSYLDKQVNPGSKGLLTAA